MEAVDLYVSGFMYGSYLKTDAHNINTKVNSTYSAYLLKFSKNGDYLSGNTISALKGAWISALAVKDEEVYIGGGTGSGILYMDSTAIVKDEKIGGLFIMKLGKDGNVAWSELGSSLLPASVNFVNINKDNTIFFTSTFRDSLIFQNSNINASGKGQKPFGDLDIAVFKLDNNGKEIWHYNYGNKNYDEAYTAAVDKYENLYIASKLTGELTLANNSVTGKEDGDVLLLKFTGDGNIANIRLSESGYNGIGQANPTGGILTMDNGDVFISGWFNSQTTFSDVNLKNRSNHDGFVWRISNLATGIEEKAQANVAKIDVYPNPTNGKVYIKLPESQGKGIFMLSDIWGRMVYSQMVSDHNQTQDLNLSNLPKGTYIIHYKTDNSISTTKVILQ